MKNIPTEKEMVIFTVDNDKYNVMLIKDLLLEVGFKNVRGYYSGEEILEHLVDEVPDLILSDIMMPEMNGYDLCKIIKSNQKWKHVPIIMITAASMHGSESLKKSFDYGAMDFLSKPINDIELIARVKSALNQVRQRKELEIALEEVKTLKGLLPICSYCKKIRNDSDYWQEIETFISAHSKAEFSHSVCPSCYEKYVKPQLDELRERKKNKNK